MFGYCYVFLFRLIEENLRTERIQCNRKKTQSQLNCHFKFFSMKNIIFVKSSSTLCHTAYTNFRDTLNSSLWSISLGGLQNYSLCSYIAVVDKLLLVGQHCYVHVKKPIGEGNISLSLLLQQCPTCLVRLVWIVFEMRGKWRYSCFFVWCCFQDSFNIEFICCSRLPFSLCVLSASVWCSRTIILTLLRRNPVSLYQIDKTSIWSITYR